MVRDATYSHKSSGQTPWWTGLQATIDELYFSCEVTHYGKSSVSVFQEFFGSIGKIHILKDDWVLDYKFMNF